MINVLALKLEMKELTSPISLALKSIKTLAGRGSPLYYKACLFKQKPFLFLYNMNQKEANKRVFPKNIGNTLL